jgi:hypothetical protein
MPDYDTDTNEAGERAQQQLRDLANAVRNAARNLNSAYPDTTKGDRIIRGYQQETHKIVQRGRQRTDRSIGASSSQPARAGTPEVVGVLLLFSAFVLLGLFIAAVFLFAPLGLFLGSESWRDFCADLVPHSRLHGRSGKWHCRPFRLNRFLCPDITLHKRRNTEMVWFHEASSQHRQLCSAAFTFAQIAEQTIFAQLTDTTTQQQYKLAQERLRQLCSELAASVDWDHYPSSFGTIHSCVQDVYTDAISRLRNLAIMQPEPPQPPPPQLISREGIVIDREEKIQTNRAETHLGTDDTQPGNRNTR